MGVRSDWVPGRRTDQLVMAKIWCVVLGKMGAQWDISGTDLEELNALVNVAEEVLGKAMSSERTGIITAKCREAFDELIACMRRLKARKFFTPPLTDADLISLGLKPHDIVKTAVGEPEGQAEASITYPGPHLLLLHIRPIAGTTLDTRNDYGFCIYYGIMPQGGASLDQASSIKRYLMNPPVSGEELPFNVFTVRKKEMFDFPAEDSGKTAYFCIRYENRKGKRGPWGPVFSAVIP